MKVDVITAPDVVYGSEKGITLFLGGSIEQGTAIDWQADLITYLSQAETRGNLQVYNPRRGSWDPSWPINDPDHEALRNQIQWELVHQDKADILVYYFAGDTLSPITLFELGIYASRNPIIYADRSYKRYANLKVTADHFGWQIHTSLQAFQNAILDRITVLANTPMS